MNKLNSKFIVLAAQANIFVVVLMCGATETYVFMLYLFIVSMRGAA